MNWKDMPNLFANGKFSIKENKFNFPENIEIEGYSTEFHGCFLILNGALINVRYCTLVARKIEDMTDEEVRKCPTFTEQGITPLEEIRYRLMVWANYHYADMPAVVQNYLLSIGIYPFDQSDFGTRNVSKGKRL